MKKSKTPKSSNSKLRLAQALQIREYIERYRPDLRRSEVEISPCGHFASVRKSSEGQNKKPK